MCLMLKFGRERETFGRKSERENKIIKYLRLAKIENIAEENIF